MIPIAIVAHPERYTMALGLKASVGSAHLVWDDPQPYSTGAVMNHARALRWHHQQYHPDSDRYCVVLEDDAVLVDNFISQLEQVLAVAPCDVVNLYLGTGYPAQWQDILRKEVSPFGADPNFLLAPEMLSMVGYAVRARFCDGIADTLQHNAHNMGADAAMSRFCRQEDLAVAYSRPSIIDHRDATPIITTRFDGQDRTKARRAWKFGSRERWSNESHFLSEPKLVSVDERGQKWFEAEGQRFYEA